MPKVAVFSTNFLEYSQTFVYEEITHHQRYQVEVFCRARKLSDRFPFAPVHEGGLLYGVTRESAELPPNLSAWRLRSGARPLWYGLDLCRALRAALPTASGGHLPRL